MPDEDSTTPTTANDPKDDANARVVLDFLAALESFDLAAAERLLAPGVLYQNVPLPPARGRAATLRQLKLMTRHLTAFEVVTHDIAANGDTVLTSRTDVLVRGGFRAEFWVAGTFRVRDGRIVLWRDYFDWTTFALAGLKGLIGLALPGSNKTRSAHT
ncbi:limonene-1,2-epoxide hydrolase family protein [Actinocorallia sp. A-T 12471]|uniref:limonene-1,2-epoxide hydrolase family protein n=1 Tax=Actinocorallia sp. A-T 12471 TaxID=3089813 RepID=UPI0029CD1C30|nr:limonene-1,2-epoxide hydrolase family protein [Actinocorallia sp. A-T 12471]MDX6743568.1 limonene-1,2-epoxide hydrolase family protein [Actinocorallia sp. A-T 12471]